MGNLRTFCATFLLFAASINVSAGHVLLLNPVGGEAFYPGINVTISWKVQIEHVPVDWDLYFSPDGGETWQELGSFNKEVLEYQWTVPNIETEQGQIRIVQDNEGEDYDAISPNFRISKSGVITAIEDPLGSSAEFQFLINYPNPFQSSTTIEFALGRDNPVSLEIYNAQGAKVATLMDAELSAGQYSTTWNAAGTKPGLYLFRVQAGRFVETRKLIKLE